MMISPDGTKLYVGTGNGLTVVNTITNSITANIPDVANSALGCISTDGGKVYVVDYPGEAVTVINTATNSVTAMIGISGYPAGLCIAPNKNKMYVINYDKTVSVVSTATNTVESVFSLNTTPTGIRISADGSRLYIMHYGLPDDNLGSISVVNTADNSPVALILLNHKPVGMSIDPGAAKIFVTHTDVPLVSVINTITNQLVDSIALGHLVAVPGDFISNVSPCASCANNYWLGTASNAWENTANWSCNTLPGPTTNVIINSGTVVLNSNTTVNTLIVNPGVSFTINTGFKLDVLH
jgi:YVTN family beta-propeller protein